MVNNFIHFCRSHNVIYMKREVNKTTLWGFRAGIFPFFKKGINFSISSTEIHK